MSLKSKIIYGTLIGVLGVAALYSYYTQRIDPGFKKFAGSEIFNKVPIGYNLGIKIYTKEELGDLVDKEFPMAKIMIGHESSLWSADPGPWVSTGERYSGRVNPTHVMYFSPTSDGNYSLEIKQYKGKVHWLYKIFHFNKSKREIPPHTCG